MDVALMLPAVEPQPTKAPKGAGKTAADQSQGEAGFAGLFAGLVADGQQASGDNKQPSADTTADTATSTVIPPVFWGLLPFMPTVVPTGQNTPTQTTAVPAVDAPALAATGTPMPRQWQQQLTQAASTVMTSPQMQALVAEIAAGQANTAALPDRQAAAAVPQQAALATELASADTSAATAVRPASSPPPAMTAAAIPDLPVAPVAQVDPTQTQVAPVAKPTVEPASTTTKEAAATPMAQQAYVPPAAILPQQQRISPAQAKAPDTAEPAVAPPLAAAPASAAGEEASGTGDGNTGFAADKAAPAPATLTPSTDTTAQAPVFASMVEQRLTTPVSEVRTEAATVPASADPYNVAGQIVDHARLISRAENTEMVIKLKPEHLGELTLKIVVDSGVVSATFHTASAEVRGAIEASLPQLRQDMAGQGLKVDYVGVYASLDHFFANDQRHAPQQPELPQARRANSDEAFQETAALAAAASGPRLDAGGIDYRV